jgi:hypothetical protein
LETDSDKASSSDSNKNFDILTDSGRDDSATASGSQVLIWSRPQDTSNSGGIHPFTGGTSGLMIQEELHVNKDSTPIIVGLLFFTEVIQKLVEELKSMFRHS